MADLAKRVPFHVAIGLGAPDKTEASDSGPDGDDVSSGAKKAAVKDMFACVKSDDMDGFSDALETFVMAVMADAGPKAE